MAKYLSDINSNIRTIKTQFYSFLIVLIPIVLIILQPDPGTVIIFLSFLLVFYKVGLPSIYMNLFVGFVLIFFSTILLGPFNIISSLIILTIILFYLFRKNKKFIKKIFIYGSIFSILFFQ